ILVLAVVAVVRAQPLPAMYGIVGGIHVQDDRRRRLAAGPDKDRGQMAVDDLQPLRLGLIDLAEDRAFGGGEFGLATREGILEGVPGETAGQGAPWARWNTG